MIYYMFSIYLVIIGMMMLIMSLFLLLNKNIFFIEFEVLKFSSIKFNYLILMDWISIMFISVVMLISSMVMFYSIEYMNNELKINRFMILILLFVFFMMLMILSPNMISILLGWDGLGLISYCLVIYYQNEVSFNSGMVTVLTNRVGDIFILMMIGLLTSLGSWNFMFYNNLNNFMLFMLLVISMTKSAQIPFSSWLPMAMAAPTPVSSLVHSSTLVTAGVYMLIRYNYLFNNMSLLMLMMLISILTMFMSGLAANLENDLKKIIAFSTLSQLGVMFFCLSIKLPEVSYFHLLTHAMFKSMLFMCSGVIIHNMLGHQDIRYIGLVMYNFPMICILFNCSTLSLCGIPFLSGFFSKDMILEMFLMSNFNKFNFLILFISMGLSVSYSIRVIYYSFIKISNINYFFYYKSLSSLMSLSMLYLFFMSVFLGSILSWLLFSMKNIIFLTKFYKMVIYIFMFMGIMLGLLISQFLSKNLFLMKYNILMKFFMLMWFLPFFFSKKMIKFFIYNQKLNYYMDLGWNEYLMGIKIYYWFKKIFFMDLFNKNFFYLMIFMFYFLLMMLIF